MLLIPSNSCSENVFMVASTAAKLGAMLSRKSASSDPLSRQSGRSGRGTGRSFSLSLQQLLAL